MAGYTLCLLCTSYVCIAAVFGVDYRLVITTLTDGTSLGPIFITIKGSLGELEEFQLVNPVGRSKNTFWADGTNVYSVDKEDVGNVCYVKLRLGSDDGWTVGTVTITKKKPKAEFKFIFNIEIDDSTVLYEDRKINPVDGKWGSWGEWPPCSAGCNETQRLHRYRFCNSPMPRCGGLGCEGDYNESKLCYGERCTTTTNIVTSTTSTYATSTTTAILVEPVYQKSPSRLIVVGVLLGLSLALCVLLAVFLAVVLRDRRHDRAEQKKVSMESNGANDNMVYVNQTMAAE